MGGRRLRPISFGNGQNRKKGYSPHIRGNQCHNYSVNKRQRPETDLLHIFSFLDVVEAPTFSDQLVTVAELQSQNFTSHMPVSSDSGRRSTGRSAANRNVHVNRLYVVDLQCIHVDLPCIHMSVVHRN